MRKDRKFPFLLNKVEIGDISIYRGSNAGGELVHHLIAGEIGSYSIITHLAFVRRLR